MPASRPIRAYTDTSVFGGVFDAAFAQASGEYFRRVRGGEIVVLISEVTERELAGAPDRVQEVLTTLEPGAVHRCRLSAEALALTEAYLKAAVVTPRWRDDAAHVAVATLNWCDALVSWNFKHIVRLDRVRAFNAVNLRLGYPQLMICSPQEVLYARPPEGL